jgi:hypothetical protein
MELAHRALNDHNFLIINPMQVTKEEWDGLPLFPLVPDSFKAQKKLMPVLIDLTQMSFDEKADLRARADQWDEDYDEPFFSVLISSNENIKLVCNHLIRQMIITNPSGKKYWLRFHDPRTFMHLPSIFNSTQMTQILGPAAVWTYRNPFSGWVRYNNNEKKLSVNLTVDERQWKLIEKIGLLNRCLKKIARTRNDIEVNDALVTDVNTLLKEAVVFHRLEDEDDQILYVEQAICINRAIHRRPEILNALMLAKSGEITYLGACAEIEQAITETTVTEKSPLANGELL